MYREIIKNTTKRSIKGKDFKLPAVVPIVLYIIDGEIKLSDHDRYEWVTLEEINNYKIAPADIPLIEKLK